MDEIIIKREDSITLRDDKVKGWKQTAQEITQERKQKIQGYH